MERSLTGHLVSASTPETIEADLSTLWRTLAQDAPTTARAVMSNLVVFREASSAEDADVAPPLDEVAVIEVASRHPARVIVLAHARGEPDCASSITASVGILIFGSGEMRHAVEQIAVRSRCAEPALPSIVRRLTRGDMPTSVWWTGDLSRTAPLTALVTIGRQLVYDSREWTDVPAGISLVTGLLNHPNAPSLADLNWRRLMPMRQAIGQGLRAAGELIDGAALRARVLYQPGEEALAWLLIGWLSWRLGRPSERELAATAIEQPGGAQAMSVSIDSGEGTPLITVTREDHRLTMMMSSPGSPLPSVTVPQESDAAGVAAELLMLGRDTGLIESVRAAHVRLTARATR